MPMIDHDIIKHKYKINSAEIYFLKKYKVIGYNVCSDLSNPKYHFITVTRGWGIKQNITYHNREDKAKIIS